VIFGETAVVLNLLSIVAFSVLLMIVVVSAFIHLKGDSLSRYSASSRRQFYWLLALSPWFVGLLAVTLLLFSGSQYFPLLGVFELLHWHHPEEFVFSSWHSLSLGVAVAYGSFLIMRSVKKLIVNHCRVKQLHALAEPDKNNFFQLDANAPMAFTAGYFRPQCYMTSTLHSQLTAEEYTIVRLHENEHARCADPFKKWFFQLLTAFFPLAIARQLNHAMSLAMEQNADAAVVRVITDKAKIAMTLLKVKRLSLGIHDHYRLEQDALCHFGQPDREQDTISERIHYLLSDEKESVLPIYFIMLAAIPLSLVCALSADLFHHVIEYSLSH